MGIDRDESKPLLKPHTPVTVMDIALRQLMRYAWHKQDCQINHHVYPAIPCSCGFNELLEKLKK